MTYYISQNGNLYTGDMASGDRPATDDEVAAHQNLASAIQARSRRDALLVIADRIINTMLDTGLDVTAMRGYRIALRNIPQQADFPRVIHWPALPQDAPASTADLGQLEGLLN